MTKHTVTIAKYEDSSSIEKLITDSGIFDSLKPGEKVFLKPNIVFWSDKTIFPKWGVLTTTRVIEGVVKGLVDRGITDITVGEGIVTLDPKNTESARHAFKTLGYDDMKERYGIDVINVMEEPYEKIDVEGSAIHVNRQAVESDCIINLPVMKTHAQTVVSLGMKNLKGLMNVASRKKFHSPEEHTSLEKMISRLYRALPRMVAVIDGIYTLERGPGPDGKARRSDILVASDDPLSADMAGAKVLGYEPGKVPHLVHAAEAEGRPVDFSDIEFRGVPVDEATAFHDYDFPYNEDGSLHRKMEKMGVQGLTYWKYDDTMCTYCSFVNGAVLSAIMLAWKGEAWDKVEILTGKKMRPTPGMNRTVLLGQCMYNLNKDDPNIKELHAIKGCPPDPADAVKALHDAGIPVEPAIFLNLEGAFGFFMGKYKDKPEFDESFFTV